MKKTDRIDGKFMRQALNLAMKGAGTVSPNPMVGAVIVKAGKIIGKGYHQKAGLAHAEVNAVRDAKARKANCAGATIYVTLEPCSSIGRTAPCTDLIIREQFARVVIGCLDPDKRHAGKGFAILGNAGIQVDAGCLEDECLALNRIFFTHKILKRPYFIGKIALTKDDKINGHPGKWITTALSRKHAHYLRFQTDAVMVGAGTVLADNPSLTLRHGYDSKGKEQPWRIILDSKGLVPATSKLLSDEFRNKTLHLSGKSFPKQKGRLVPQQIARWLAGKNISSCLIEGGVKVLESFFKAGLIDEFYLYESTTVKSVDSNSLDGRKLLRYLGRQSYRVESRGAKSRDRLTRYISSSSQALLRTISAKRRRRAAVLPKRK